MRSSILAAMLFVLALTPRGFAGTQDAKPTRLTAPELGKMLETMGMDPKDIGGGWYQLILEKSNWKTVMNLTVGPDKSLVWLEAKFTKIEKPEEVPPATWRRVLAKNDEITNASFSYNAKQQRVILTRSFENGNLTASQLRKQIMDFDALVQATQDVWRSELFKSAAPQTPAAPQKEFDAIRGTYTLVGTTNQGTVIEAAQVAEMKLTIEITDGKLVAKKNGELTQTSELKVDAAKTPVQIDVIGGPNSVELGIFKVEGDTLTICFAAPGSPRPTEFGSVAEAKTSIMVLKRVP